MRSILFLPMPPVACRRTGTSRRVLVAKLGTKGQEKNLPIPPQRKARVSKEPPNVPALLRNPEAVLAATAAGIFVLVRLAYRSSKSLFASLEARMKNAEAFQSRVGKLVARKRERDFLESAVLSTQTTLENTQSFLAAQQSRVQSAEARLSQLGVSRERLERASDEVRHRRKELADAEFDLEKERERVGTDTSELHEMEASVVNVRSDLQAFEQRLQTERGELDFIEFSQRERLDDARKETSRLEALLLEKELELKREEAQRDLYLSTVAEAGVEYSAANENLARAAKELKNKRTRLRELADEDIKSNSSQPERLGMTSHGNGTDDVEASLERIQSQQTRIRAELTRVRRTQEKRISERERLKREVAMRDSKLQHLRHDLDALNLTKETSVAQIEATQTVAETQNVTEVNQATLHHPVSVGSVPSEESIRGLAGDKQPVKRKRGRPRKHPVSEPAQVDSSEPKRGRGRPRKVVGEAEVGREAVPKRKRGRPRKNPVATLVGQHADSL